MNFLNLHNESEINYLDESFKSYQDEKDKYDTYYKCLMNPLIKERIEKVIDKRIEAFMKMHGFVLEKLKFLVKVNKISLLVHLEENYKYNLLGIPWEKKTEEEIKADRKKEVGLNVHKIVKENKIKFDKSNEDTFKPTIPINKKRMEQKINNMFVQSEENEERFDNIIPIYVSFEEEIDFEYSKWKNMFLEDPKYEIEMRFGNIVSGARWGYLFDFFMNNEDFKDPYNFTTIVESGLKDVRRVTKMYDNKIQKGIPKVSYEKKENIQTVRIRDLGINIAKSLETPISDLDITNFQSNIIRKKNVFRFYTKDNIRSPFNNLETTLSVVMETSFRTDLKKSIETLIYDIEIERIAECGILKYTPDKALKTILSVMEGPLYVQEYPFIIKRSIQNEIINWLHDIFEVMRKERIVLYFINKVVAFEEKHFRFLITRKCYMTLKLDGKRCLLVMLPELGSYIVKIDDSITKIGNKFNMVQKTQNIKKGIVFDCELYEREKKKSDLYIFDTLYYNKDLRSLNFNVRLGYAEKFMEKNKILSELFVSDITVKVKEFYPVKKLTDLKKLYEKYENNDKYGIYDGIIFQEDSTYNSPIYKWKEGCLNSVDISIPFNNIEKANIIGDPILYGKNDIRRTFEQTKMIKIIDLNTNYLKYKNINLSNFIVECWVNRFNNKLIPSKLRTEKKRENAEDVIQQTLRMVSDGPRLTHFLGKNLIIMRKIISSLKYEIFESFTKNYSNRDLVLLDVGSGQGGDIGKWNNFKQIIAYEFNPQMIEIFEDRLKKRRNLNVDIKKEMFKSNSIDDLKEKKIDIVCFFSSVNYLFEDEIELETLLKRLNELGNDSTTFFFLFQDGDYIKKKYKGVTNKHSEYFSFIFVGENKVRTTIKGSYVSDVDEFLFKTKRFLEILNKIDLYIVNYIESDYLFDILNPQFLSEPDKAWLKSYGFIELRKKEQNHFIFKKQLKNVFTIESEDEMSEDEDLHRQELETNEIVDKEADFDEEEFNDNIGKQSIIEDDEKDKDNYPLDYIDLEDVFKPEPFISTEESKDVQIYSKLNKEINFEEETYNKYTNDKEQLDKMKIDMDQEIIKYKSRTDINCTKIKKEYKSFVLTSNIKSDEVNLDIFYCLLEYFLNTKNITKNDTIYSNLPKNVFSCVSLLENNDFKFSVLYKSKELIGDGSIIDRQNQNIEGNVISLLFNDFSDLMVNYSFKIIFEDIEKTEKRLKNVLIVTTLNEELYEHLNFYENFSLYIPISYPCFIFYLKPSDLKEERKRKYLKENNINKFKCFLYSALSFSNINKPTIEKNIKEKLWHLHNEKEYEVYKKWLNIDNFIKPQKNTNLIDNIFTMFCYSNIYQYIKTIGLKNINLLNSILLKEDNICIQIVNSLDISGFEFTQIYDKLVDKIFPELIIDKNNLMSSRNFIDITKVSEYENKILVKKLSDNYPYLVVYNHISTDLMNKIKKCFTITTYPEREKDKKDLKEIQFLIDYLMDYQLQAILLFSPITDKYITIFKHIDLWIIYDQSNVKRKYSSIDKLTRSYLFKYHEGYYITALFYLSVKSFKK
uniref:mRNA (guanine-N(7))-methyltransferase n=1 Tax=viral metagenome TaxID=1070528 RepID=A0A6C0JPT1_9ZZZZ